MQYFFSFEKSLDTPPKQNSDYIIYCFKFINLSFTDIQRAFIIIIM